MAGFAHIEVRPNGDVVLIDTFAGVSGGDGTDGGSGTVDESDITLYDVTTDNATTSRHGFLRKLSGNASEYLDGTGNWTVPSSGFFGSITEAQISLSDVTTDDVTTSRHGFVPKAPNDTTKFLRGDATWAVVALSGAASLGVDSLWNAKGDLAVGLTDNTAQILSIGATNGYVLTVDSTKTLGMDWEVIPKSTRSLNIVVGGAGSVVSTGIAGDVVIDFNCTISQWTLLADQSGSIQIDIWKDTYANYPPTVADTITASAKPLISSATKNQSSTLTGWTTNINAGDTLRFNVDSATTITRATLCLKLLV